MQPLCIYHGNCADGFGAAWAVWKIHPDWEFYPGVHQDPPPDVTDRDVVIVDFSYKRPMLEDMASKARSILILDHHKTAAEDLAEFPEPPEDLPGCRGWLPSSGVYATFDMGRSGAGIAWDHFHGTSRPRLIDHIEDRDLWKFELEGTREIQAAVFSYKYDFDVWDALMLRTDLNELRLEGVAIERKHHKDIDELIGVVTRRMVVGGHNVPVANLPYTLTSDAGHKLAKGESFAGCYWDTPEGRVFSLRSTDEGLDVSEIAKSYGGGGHRNASGFRVPFSRIEEFEISTAIDNGDEAEEDVA